jgi:hypothetical protein
MLLRLQARANQQLQQHQQLEASAVVVLLLTMLHLLLHSSRACLTIACATGV